MNESVTGAAGDRLPSRGRTARTVPFLFGVARRAELPGPALVRLLGDLGSTPAAARAGIARLRREGNLVATRHGRSVGYRLGGDLAAGFERIRAGTPAAPEWPGHFHALIHQVPESDRGYRDRLRRAAVLGGFGVLAPGVLVSLTRRWDALAPILDAAPPGAVLYRARLGMDDADAARAAAQAWDLATLHRRYAAHLRTLRAALDRPAPGPGPAALRHYTDLVSPVLVDTLRAPALPAPLRPAHWALPDLRDTLDALGRKLFPAVAAHVATVLRPDGDG